MVRPIQFLALAVALFSSGGNSQGFPGGIMSPMSPFSPFGGGFPGAMPFGGGFPGSMPFGLGLPSPFMSGPSCFTVCTPPSPMMFPMMPWTMPIGSPSTCESPVEPAVEPAAPTDPDTVVSKNFTVTFDLNNYPLDVYYLMDYSGTMSDDKESLVSLSAKLIESIKELSSDFTLGFGAFVDKPIGDFGSADHHDYSFQNILSLSADTSTFRSHVQDTMIRFGGDSPEGSADALFQVAACTAEIGWRKDARHLVVLVTDDDIHLAPEGIDAGVVSQPFDGKCHLDATGKYTEEATLDYPSIDQLATITAENQINVIFALTASATRYYTKLTDAIKTSVIGTLAADSSNIIDLLKNTYAAMTETAELEVTDNTVDIIRADYACTEDEVAEGTTCKVNADGSVTFTVVVERLCPADRTVAQELTVKPVGIPYSKTIDISSMCL